MPTSAAAILAHLRTVERVRARHAQAPDLAANVAMLKTYQQRRFSLTYGDLLQNDRYGPASNFFLDELYGPTDFTRRDTQFARVVPALVRLFPSEIVDTVATLAELHALSETLDSTMAAQFHGADIGAVDYIRAWQATGRRDDRLTQISLTVDVAGRLDRFTRRVLMRNSLWLMRGPARAAGLTELQQFLEAGFETFRDMNGADEFISIVSEREQTLTSLLFEAIPERVTDSRTVRTLASLP